MKASITDSRAESVLARNKGGGLKNANRLAREVVDEAWRVARQPVGTGVREDVISQLSAWSKNAWGVSFSSEQIARELRADEVDLEVAVVIESILATRPFKPAAVVSRSQQPRKRQ